MGFEPSLVLCSFILVLYFSEKNSIHCKQTRGDLSSSAAEVSDQSLPGAKFISSLQCQNFPSSTRGIFKAAGNFRRIFRFQKIRMYIAWERSYVLLHTNRQQYLCAADVCVNMGPTYSIYPGSSPSHSPL